MGGASLVPYNLGLEEPVAEVDQKRLLLVCYYVAL